jgi:heme exporter protein D
MIRKLAFALVVAAVVVVALWRMGVIDRRRVTNEASDLQQRAEEKAKQATKAAREAVESRP